MHSLAPLSKEPALLFAAREQGTLRADQGLERGAEPIAGSFLGGDLREVLGSAGRPCWRPHRVRELRTVKVIPAASSRERRAGPIDEAVVT